MAYKFTFTEIISDYSHIEDKFGRVEIKKPYIVHNYDDLKNLFLTLVDFGPDEMTFTVKKEIIEEEAAVNE